MSYIRLPNTVDFLEITQGLTKEQVADWFQRPNTAYQVLSTPEGYPGRIKAWDSQAGFVQFDLAVQVGTWIYVEKDRLGQVVDVSADNWNLGPDTARFAPDPYEES